MKSELKDGDVLGSATFIGHGTLGSISMCFGIAAVHTSKESGLVIRSYFFAHCSDRRHVEFPLNLGTIFFCASKQVAA